MSLAKSISMRLRALASLPTLGEVVVEVLTTLVDSGVHDTARGLHRLVSVLVMILVLVQGEGAMLARRIFSIFQLIEALVDLNVPQGVLILGLVSGAWMVPRGSGAG